MRRLAAAENVPVPDGKPGTRHLELELRLAHIELPGAEPVYRPKPAKKRKHQPIPAIRLRENLEH